MAIFGPLNKLFKMAQSAKMANQTIKPNDLSGWIQQATCIAGNTSFSIEHRKGIFFKWEPNLALTEAGNEAEGFLFGESFG